VSSRATFFLVFSLALNVVLTVFVISELRVVRNEVRALPATLMTKDDAAALRPLRIQQILNSRCAQCHTDRRFAAVLGWERQPILDVVDRMAAHPGANIPSAEFEAIQASLTLLQCTRCHSEAVLSRLAFQTPAQQVTTVRRMQRMPESGIRADQVPQILEAFKTLSGQR
jgi:hypothetical protein